MTQPALRTELLLDSVLPEYDETIVEHVIVDAPLDTVYPAVRTMNLLDVHSPLMDAAMFLRGLPERVGRWVRRDPSPEMPSAVTVGRLFDGEREESFLSGWVPLGEHAPYEIVFGAAGKVWQPEIDWRQVPPEDFAGFDEPGFAKIAANFSLREYGETRTLLTYEARTATTDPASQQRFRRYWWLVHVFVGVVMRAALRTAKDIAENESGGT